MSETTTPLRTALIGCGGMGRSHARTASSLPEFEMAAACDVNETLLAETLEKFPGAKAYTDAAVMLAEEKLDAVIIGTGNSSHAALTIQAAEAGARGVFCEKPMAVSMGEAQAMVAACEANKTALMINHQRRIFPAFTTMRRLMVEGAIGEIKLIRGTCMGDVLSDATHLVDTIRHLAGDAEVKWVFGQITRDPVNPDEPHSFGYTPSGGWRYGHPIENGSCAIWEFNNGIRAEIFAGSMHVKGHAYSDYEVFGTEGRMRRAGDAADPPLIIQDGQAGGWRAVPLDQPQGEDSVWSYVSKSNFTGLAKMISEGADHPLSGASALKDMEVCMAILKSARLRSKINLPLNQPRYPLEIMIENGEM